MPTAKIATEFAMIQSSPTRSATAAPMIEQAMAPTISDAIGANSDSISAARISGGEFRVRPAGLDQLLDQHVALRGFPTRAIGTGHCFNTRQIARAYRHS